MSVELGVRLAESITVGELCAGVSQTMKELVSVSDLKLTAYLRLAGTVHRISEVSSIVSDGLVMIQIPDADAEITLNTMPSIENAEKTICLVSAEHSRSPIEITLALGCAIWLARRCGSKIADEWCFWTDLVSITPDELCRRVAVAEVPGLEAACIQLVGDRAPHE